MSFNAALLQPMPVFFELQIAGLSEIYRYPEVPIDFRMSIKQGGVAEVEFTLKDLTGTQVEQHLWDAVDKNVALPKGKFQFGYLNGAQSPLFEFFIDDFIPVFSGNSFVITVVGSCPTLSPFLSNNQFSGTIQEILEKFCKVHSLELKVDPPFGASHMMDAGYNDNKSTTKTEMRHHKWANESDAGYLERILLFARDGEGKGGYNWNIGQDKDGKQTLSVFRPQNRGADLEYTVQDKDTVVIDWKPDISFTKVIWGQNDVMHHSYSRITGDEMKSVEQQHLTEPYQETFGYPNSVKPKSTPTHDKADKRVHFNTETMPDSVTGSNVRAFVGASVSPFAGLNPSLNRHLRSWMQGFTATLTVLGDPSVGLMSESGGIQLVDVTCFWPLNYLNQYTGKRLHYSSGTYILEEVEHVIQAGSFITVLHLFRANSPTPDAGSEDN